MKQIKYYDTVLLYMEGYSRKQTAEILHIPTRLSVPILALSEKENGCSAKERFGAIFSDRYMHNRDITSILLEDESIIWDYQTVMKTFFLKGKQRTIPTF